MTFPLKTKQSGDALSLTELNLYHQIMDYRAEQGLDPIPLSTALTATAGRHAADSLYNIWQAGLDLPPDANLHSWSDAPYYGDHRDPAAMWYAPARIGIDYPSKGFEISAAGYRDITAALNGWKSSPGHNAVMANTGIWADTEWNAIGIGVASDSSVTTYGGRIYHVWFGDTADPTGTPFVAGTRGDNAIKGTEFNDRIAGLGGDDSMRGRAGADAVRGGTGNDKIAGNGGADKIRGGPGADVLKGGKADDIILGGAGKDRIIGNRGNDDLAGGRGPDTFVFRGSDFGRDRVTGYDPATDMLRIGGEVGTKAAFKAALTDTAAGLLYDYGGDGENTIFLAGVDEVDLEFRLIELV